MILRRRYNYEICHVCNRPRHDTRVAWELTFRVSIVVCGECSDDLHLGQYIKLPNEIPLHKLIEGMKELQGKAKFLQIDFSQKKVQTPALKGNNE